jgi:prostaglandin-E synthase 1
MLIDTANPAFLIYAIVSLVLVANLIFLWVYSGVVRTGSGLVINPEDGVQYDTPVGDVDPPEVARVLRAHRNSQAMTVPFLILGLVFVLAGGGTLFAAIIFGVFTIARIWHSIVYLRGKQPWRTTAFVVSLLALLVLMLDIVWLVVRVFL